MLIPTAHAQSSSMSLHLSRRVLTQSKIQDAIDRGAVAMPPVGSFSSFDRRRVNLPHTAMAALQIHKSQTAKLARTLSSRALANRAVPLSREHADFMHRML